MPDPTIAIKEHIKIVEGLHVVSMDMVKEALKSPVILVSRVVEQDRRIDRLERLLAAKDEALRKILLIGDPDGHAYEIARDSLNITEADVATDERPS